MSERSWPPDLPVGIGHRLHALLYEHDLVLAVMSPLMHSPVAVIKWWFSNGSKMHTSNHFVRTWRKYCLG